MIKGEQVQAGIVKPVKARGLIKAKIWYESYGEAKYKEIKNIATGNKSTYISLGMANKEYVIQGNKDPFALFEKTEVHKNFVLWRNSNYNVEINIVSYYEQQQHVFEKAYDIALDEAKHKALVSVEQFIPQSADILTRHTDILQTSEPDLIRVKLSLETIEDIVQ